MATLERNLCSANSVRLPHLGRFKLWLLRDTIPARFSNSSARSDHMADPVWYYARGEVERGPFTLTQIKALANASKLRPDDLVWKEGMDNWTAAKEVAELFPPAGLVADAAATNGS